MPRACSSGRRSVSFPVSARTSHVFPWSMWPAVPTVSGIGGLLARRRDGRGDLLRLSVSQRAAVEEQPPVADDADHCRIAVAQGRSELLVDRAGEAREL